jgi:hypothetical protein
MEKRVTSTIYDPKIIMPPVCAKCGEIKAIICFEVKYNIDLNCLFQKLKFASNYTLERNFVNVVGLMSNYTFIFVCSHVATMIFVIHASKGMPFAPLVVLA